MSKPDWRVGGSTVNRLARMAVQSVGGIAVPAKEQPYVHEHEGGGWYVATVESGYTPPPGAVIPSFTQAMATARIMACDLLVAIIGDARREAEADLGQGELDLDGRAAAEPDEGGDVLSLPAGRMALPAGDVLDAEFRAEEAGA